jgi:hypothetical protein
MLPQSFQYSALRNDSETPTSIIRTAVILVLLIIRKNKKISTKCCRLLWHYLHASFHENRSCVCVFRGTSTVMTIRAYKSLKWFKIYEQGKRQTYIRTWHYKHIFPYKIRGMGSKCKVSATSPHVSLYCEAETMHSYCCIEYTVCPDREFTLPTEASSCAKRGPKNMVLYCDYVTLWTVGLYFSIAY